MLERHYACYHQRLTAHFTSGPVIIAIVFSPGI
ncbi:TetR family transcriptional regulator, partial [Salmonella enterica subsp. enterica serovar Heidelberg str. 607310-1]